MSAPGAAHFFYGVQMHVYFDESGDLGWTFNKPYGAGGSSRYLTIAFLIIEPKLTFVTKRIVRNIYRMAGHSFAKELKGSRLRDHEKVQFVQKVRRMLQKHSTIKLAAITVDKRNIEPHIRNDKNFIYNYMIKLVIPEYIKTYNEVSLFPDPRSIKVKSQNSMKDYLQTHFRTPDL